MSNPRYFDRERTDTEDTVVVASAFALVALALGGLIYAYSGPEKQIQAASNLPSLIDVAPGHAAQ
jgi:hypothetical protein